MPVELATMWLATLLLAIVLLALRQWLKRRRQAPPPLAPDEPAGEAGNLAALRRWLLEPVRVKARRAPVAPRPAPLFDHSPAALRGLIATLLMGGLLLVLMGQVVTGSILPQERGRLTALLIAGFVAFAVAGWLALGRKLPAPLLGLAGRLAAFLGVSLGQLAALLLAPAFALMASLAAGEVLAMRHPVVAMVAWLAAIAAVVTGSRRPGELSRLRTAIRLREVGLVAALVAGAFFLRAVALDRFPDTLSGDEGSAGLIAARFLSGEANNPFTVGWFSFPSLFFAVQSLGLLLLGQTTEGLRLTSAAAGALTVGATYWLARLLFDRRAAVLAALFLLASHYHIHFSRIGLNNIWDGLFVALALAALWYGWRRGLRLGFIICGLALGFGLYFYVSFRAVPVLLLLWAVVAGWFEPAKFRRHLPDLALAALIAAVVFLPLGLFFANHPDEFQAPLNRVTILKGWLDNEVVLTGRSATEIVRQQMATTALGFTHRPLRLLYEPGAPLLLAGPAALFLLGLLWALIDLDLRYLLLFLPLLAVVFLGGFSQDPPASQRYVTAIPLVAILVALPICRAAAWLANNWPRYRQAVWAVAILQLLWLGLLDIHFYFGEVYDHYVLGGVNTVVATKVAHYLEEQGPQGRTVYFFGFPRMGYTSLSTIPYLVPEADGQDVLEPLREPPTWPITGPTEFIALPERAGELELVRQAYPGGAYREFKDEAGLPLFMVYEAAPRPG
jgi:hypothetical protein